VTEAGELSDKIRNSRVNVVMSVKKSSSPRCRL
jgi:hypothetical protein